MLNGLARSDQNLALVRQDRSSTLDGAVLGYVNESYYLQSESPEARLSSTWFGDAADLKICACDAALSLLREERPLTPAARRVFSLSHEAKIETETALVAKTAIPSLNRERELATC